MRTCVLFYVIMNVSSLSLVICLAGGGVLMDEILVRLVPALLSGIAITYFGYWLNHRDNNDQ
jgi:hypothetical protein